MTLILTVLTPERVFQASDRRLVDSTNGKPLDRPANKAIVVTCNDACFAVAYTGLAYITVRQAEESHGVVKRIQTDEWLAQVLASIDAAGKDLSTIAEHFKTRLDALKLSHLPVPIRQLTVILAGFQASGTPFYLRIPVHESILHQSPNASTEMRAMTEIFVDPQPLYGVLSEGFQQHLVGLQQQGFFNECPTEEALDELSRMIKYAKASLPRANALYVSRDCLAIEITPSGGTSAQYHPDGRQPEVRAPIIINQMGTFSDIEVEGFGIFQGISFGGDFLGVTDRVLFPRGRRALGFLSSAWEHWHRGELERVIHDCNAAIDLDPGLAETYNLRGCAHRRLGDHDHAIEDYTSALEHDPSMAEAYGNRGLTYFESGKPDLAKGDLDEALHLDPNIASAYFNRANLLASVGDHTAAIADYDKAIGIDPSDAGVYNNRGQSYFVLRDMEHGIKDFNRAIELDPMMYQAYFNRGLAYARLGNLSCALKDLDAALELQPNDQRLIEERAKIQQRLRITEA